MSSSVFDSISMQHLWSTEELRTIFSEDNRIQKWLDFEAAFSQAQARLGLIPQAAADTISAHANVANIDIPQMAAEMRAIKHSLVPMLKQLIAAVWRSWAMGPLWTTTQDVLDTGTVLQLKQAHAVFLRDLKACARELARLSEAHRDTLMVGRTHGVQALPITFGHKCAIWA